MAALLAREGKHDEAGEAVLCAEECGSDGGEVVESFAPSSFTLRPLDTGPPRPNAFPSLAWSRDGKTLFVHEHAPDRTSGIVAWDLAHGRARPVALNLPIRDLLAFAAGGDGRLLVGFHERERIQLAFVERGFLQAPIGEGHAPLHSVGMSGDLVFASDGTRVRAWHLAERKPIWEARSEHVALDPVGTVATLDGKELALWEPLAAKPRVRFKIATQPALPFTARRRAVVVAGHSLLLVAGEQVVERKLDERPTLIDPSPSGRHIVLYSSSGPPTVLDLRTGAAEPIDVTDLHAGVWSPSGRKLALAGPTSELFLLEGT